MADKPPELMLSLNVFTDDASTAVKAWEVIGRAAVGLALDGVRVSTHIGRIDDEDGDD